MAKKIAGYIKLEIPAGQANPSPPVGPALGQRGLNIMEFCKAFNAATQAMEPGTPTPVIITAFADRSFAFETKTPPAAYFLRQAAGLPKGSGEPGREVLRQSVQLGAWGFISKSDEPEVLIETVATVARGRMSLPYIDLKALTTDPLAELTARERELLVALANGWTNLQIASRIGISRNTVKYHLKNLYDKLGVNNRAMAVALYVSTTMDQR